MFVFDVPRGYRKVILARASVGTFTNIAYYAAVKIMPMYTAVCIFFTIPIWSSFMAYAILKEPISIYDIFALISILVAFC